MALRPIPIRKEVKRLAGYRLAMPSCRVKLNQNESAYDLPESLKKKVLDRLAKVSWNRYPTPFCDPLRNKIAEREGWDPEGVVVQGGSNILIQALTITAAVGGKVLTVTPSFSLYEIEGVLLGNRVVQVPLKRDDFSFPRERFLKELKKVCPQVVFLANPNAPTGNLFSEEDLLAVLKAAPGMVVVDEAYYPFSRFTLLPHLKRFPNLVLIRTLSKAFSLGGVRLGYLLAAPSVAMEIRKATLPFSVGILSQTVGEVVLEDSTYIESVVREVLDEREKLFSALKQIPRLTVYPSDANYLLFQTPRAKEVFQRLAADGILIRDVSGKNLPNALRVTVGKPEENQAFLEALGRLF